MSATSIQLSMKVRNYYGKAYPKKQLRKADAPDH